MTAVKKFFGAALLTGMLVAMFSLVGCGGGSAANSELVGTWELSGLAVGGEEMPQEYMDQYLETLGDSNMEITFDNNGMAKVNFGGESGESKYTFENGKGNIEENGQSLSFEIVDGKLHMDVEGTTLIFSKK